MYGLEVGALTKRREAELEMQRFSLGVTRTSGIRNECIRGRAQIEDKAREVRLRWFGSV